MDNIDVWVVVVFSALVFVCGMSFAKSGSNMKSFFAAGGALPWWMSGLSLFMSFFSAGTFVVWGSIAYSSGWVAITIQWTMSIAGLLIGFFIAPRWRRTGALTAAQFITERLGYNTQKVYTYLFLFISIFTTAFFLYPVAKIVEVSAGIPKTGRVHAGDQSRATGSAYSAYGIHVGVTNPLVSQLIDIGGLRYFIAIATQPGAHVFGGNPKDIWSF